MKLKIEKVNLSQVLLMNPLYSNIPKLLVLYGHCIMKFGRDGLHSQQPLANFGRHTRVFQKLSGKFILVPKNFASTYTYRFQLKMINPSFSHS